MERTPTEIWQRILRLAISCSLLPLHGDYDHVQIRTISEVTCSLFLEYKQSERTRTNLRLVCASWNEFLEQYSDRFVRLTPYVPDGYWPPVKRWDRVIRLEGPAGHTCKKRCWPAFSMMSLWATQGPDVEERKKTETLIRDKHLPLLGHRCKAIISPGPWKRDLESLDHIVLLNDDAIVASDPAVYLSTLSTKYTNLQHLQIYLPTLIVPGAHIEFPLLDTLSVTLATHIDFPLPNPLLPSHGGLWDLPKLRYLEFDSTDTRICDINMFRLFLTQVGRTITHFHLGKYLLERRDVTNTLFSDNFYDSVPSLAYLGVGMHDLSQLPRLSDDYYSPPITIFLNIYRMWWWEGPPRELAKHLPKRWPPGRLGEVRLEVTWEEFRDRIHYHGASRQYSTSLMRRSFWSGDIEILDVLHITGQGLMDRAGFPFDASIRESIVSIASKAKP
ncbi:hypothetical protein M408DRAFT_203589 [Serendipita vermifera MAFF 305830]|uniref:Uncharacterized protein n=1 Tax=Serendipita vermifera MAFF 305830 TaxID=933852 RepID=A0A0C3B2L0_SERVB|nr:hypothetical protein M408DRAFT_203589 [Serendipita vermifera MAFF 305830]